MVLNFSDRDKVCSFVLDIDSSLSKGEGSVTKGINVLVIVDGLVDLGEMGTFATDVQRWPVDRIPSSNVCGGNSHCSKKEPAIRGRGILLVMELLLYSYLKMGSPTSGATVTTHR